MLVYRMENRVDKRGPYGENYRQLYRKQAKKTIQLSNTINDCHTNLSVWPTFHGDTKRRLIGCNSLDSLLRWFRGFHAHLRRCQFHIAVYDVADGDYLEGPKNQIAFDMKAKKVYTMSMPRDKQETPEPLLCHSD